MKKCHHCGTINETTAKFCKKCGQSVLTSKNNQHKLKFSKKFIITGIICIIVLVIGVLVWHQNESNKVINQVKNHGYVLTLESGNLHQNASEDSNTNFLVVFNNNGNWSALGNLNSYFDSSEMSQKISSDKKLLKNNRNQINKQFNKQEKLGNPLKASANKDNQIILGLDFSNVKLSASKKKQAQKEYPKITLYNLKKTKDGFYGKAKIANSSQKKTINVNLTKAY